MRTKAEQQQIGKSLASVVRHPIRVQALTILTERVASPKEIAEELVEDTSNVSHHVRVLRDEGLIEIVGERPVRGATEHFYRAVKRPWLTTEEWDELDLRDREQFSIWILQISLTDAARSLNAGLLDRRTDRHLSRVPLKLDEKGWREVNEIQNEALKAIIAAQVASIDRQAEGSKVTMFATATMTCFEGPPPGHVCEDDC